MYRGKVSWFNNAKGFGFLTHEGGPDVFVHHTGIDMEGYHTLKEDQEVEFDIELGSGGKPQAIRVRKLKSGLDPIILPAVA